MRERGRVARRREGDFAAHLRAKSISRQTCDTAARLIDLNHLLLFIACVSSALVLARTWKRAAWNRGWRRAAVAVLLITAATWLVAPKSAGFIGGSAWFA